MATKLELQTELNQMKQRIIDKDLQLWNELQERSKLYGDRDHPEVKKARAEWCAVNNLMSELGFSDDF